MLVRCRNRAEAVWHRREAGWTEPDTGWFGSKLVKKAAHAVSSVAKTVSHVPGVSNVVRGASLASDIAHGRNVIQSVKKQVKGMVADTRAALPVAASVASFVPGVGTGIASGLTAASALSQGKSLRQIAEEAALAAVPGGQLARSALRAGIGVARGQNVLKTVGREGISYARQNLPGGELAQRALNVGIAAAQGQNVARAAGREALSYARKNVPMPSLPGNVKSAIASITSNVPKVPMTLQRPSFGLPTSVSPETVARMRQTSIGLRRPDMRAQIAPTVQRKAGFRPLSTYTRSMLVRALPHMRGEVSGLSESGAQWVVESGDTGSKIALKLTGNANRWTELKAVNPNIMHRDPALVKKYGFPIYVNDKVNLPATWIKSTAQTAAQSAPATPSAVTPPPVVMPAGDLAAQGQARTILTAWGKSDGVKEAGVSDYGSAAEIGAMSWTARDVMQGTSFANWWRNTGGTPTVANGEWSQSLADALHRWAEQKAQQVANTALAGGGVVVPNLTAPASPAAAAPPVNAPLPSPWQTTPTATSSAPPTSITLPQVTISAPTTPFPASISVPTPLPPPQQATAPQSSKDQLSDNQKWGWGTMAAGAALSVLVRLIA